MKLPLMAKKPEVIRVRFKTGVAGERRTFTPGQVVDIDAQQAREWIKCGACEAAPDAELGRPPSRPCRSCGAPRGAFPTCPRCGRSY